MSENTVDDNCGCDEYRDLSRRQFVMGAAGVAVQNFNIMHGFSEITALPM